MSRRSFPNLLNRRLVIALEAAPECIGEQFSTEAFGKSSAVGLHNGLQLQRPLKGPAIRQCPRRVDRNLALLCAPGADGVKVLKSEPERIHSLVTGGAGGVFPVLLQLLSHRRGRADCGLIQIRNIRGRRRRSRIEDVLQNPLSAQNR